MAMRGIDAAKVFADALGLNDLPVRKIVLVADCRDIFTAYIVAFPEEGVVEKIAQFLRQKQDDGIECNFVDAVDVDEKGNVTVQGLSRERTD
jgi:hypothetical protein